MVSVKVRTFESGMQGVQTFIAAKKRALNDVSYYLNRGLACRLFFDYYLKQYEIIFFHFYTFSSSRKTIHYNIMALYTTL
jgi:hypothetical protein